MRWLNIVSWTAQALVAVSFIAGAYIKLSFPISELASMWPWAGSLPVLAVRVLGVVDLAGGVGIILPALTGIKPRLTVFAALGCVMLQICAIVFHLGRGEVDVLPVNIFLLGLSSIVLWIRWPCFIKGREA
jgi:hypothetical protein